MELVRNSGEGEDITYDKILPHTEQPWAVVRRPSPKQGVEGAPWRCCGMESSPARRCGSGLP